MVCGLFKEIKMDLYGVDLFGDVVKPNAESVINQRFILPPFTILNAQSGEWQERKRAWLALGIKSEVGRGENLMESSESTIWNHNRKKYAHTFNTTEWIKKNDLSGGAQGLGATSVFDPVLSELAYKWFCPLGGLVVDPFAGGSVRGIVAGAMGRNYWGCDLRQEQVSANIAQAAEIETKEKPQWVCGDSVETQFPDADFLFSCPPYGDLEVYSDHPQDLSNMDFHAFLAAYRRIIWRSVRALKDDSFACFVVGDFRDKKGFYRNFISETINAFEECGARLYNEAILATSVGSAAMRVTKQFEIGRKMAKVHQNVLVFCKGDWRKATAKINDSEKNNTRENT